MTPSTLSYLHCTKMASFYLGGIVMYFCHVQTGSLVNLHT